MLYSGTTIHCLEALLDAGANVNFVSRTSGVTALVQAVQCGSPDKLKTLLRAGADPNLGTIKLSPLTAALSYG
jgi:ankyrin repeat protein